MTPYYEEDGITIYHGEALDVMGRLRDASVGALLLDPPYLMVPSAKAGADDGAAGTSGAPIMLLGETLRHTRRLLRAGGVAGLVCDWRRVPDASYLVTLNGLRITTCVAWTRSSVGLGGLFRSAWDPMLVLSVGQPDMIDKAGVRNVIHADKPRNSAHPYQKPVALWRHLLDRLPLTTVVDPFMGSGSGLAAAYAGGHRYIGIEIEERYCEIAVQRLAQGVFSLEGEKP